MSKGYSRKQIRTDARKVKDWQSEGRSVYVFYNDMRGDAPKDAQA